MKKILYLIPVFIAFVLLIPHNSQALEATLLSSSPAVTDVSESTVLSDIEDLLLFGYDYGDGVALGSAYTLVYTVSGDTFQNSNGPAIILGSGADITSWSYDVATQ